MYVCTCYEKYTLSLQHLLSSLLEHDFFEVSSLTAVMPRLIVDLLSGETPLYFDPSSIHPILSRDLAEP